MCLALGAETIPFMPFSYCNSGTNFPPLDSSVRYRMAGMSDHQPTIFDKILAGEVPCWKVYEDEHVFAFLDIGPLSDGHTLVIPKERKAQLHQLSEGSAAAIGRVLPRLCRAVMSATGATAYNILQNNGAEAHQAVMHVHFHIIPKLGERGLGVGWSTSKLSEATARELQEKIRQALEA